MTTETTIKQPFTTKEIQCILDTYPGFRWTGSHSRRVKGEEKFLLGGALELELTDKDREIFTIRAQPMTVVYHLREYLLHTIGELTVNSVPLNDVTLAAMIQLVKNIDARS